MIMLERTSLLMKKKSLMRRALISAQPSYQSANTLGILGFNQLKRTVVLIKHDDSLGRNLPTAHVVKKNEAVTLCGAEIIGEAGGPSKDNYCLSCQNNPAYLG